MNDESQKPAQDLNKIDFPDSLFGENQNVEPSKLIIPAPPFRESNSRRDLGIVLGVVAILCCLVVALSMGGFYLINENSRVQDAQNTATAEVIAQAVATNRSYATGTAIAVGTQSQATAIAQATLDANATATAAVAQATQNARSTATVSARQTERANYPLIETFENNKKAWYTGEKDGEFFAGKRLIENGAYRWEIDVVKQTFVAWANYESQEALGDFDVYVDGILKVGDPENYCYGFLFRESPEGFDEGAYTFEVCEGGSFSVSYYTKENGWEQISGWLTSEAIQAGDWNTLEISARGRHFVFTVNEVQIFEMEDDRQPTGYLSLLIDVLEEAPGTIWFDNFGLQTR